jgi:hypothetical protein
MSDMTHRAFFGDAERAFLITPELIAELERKTGAGIGALCQRLFAGQFSHADITQTIRLALIGGGSSPSEADALVSAYALGRPLSETYPIAVSILETLWFGEAKQEVKQMKVIDLDALANTERGTKAERLAVLRKIREALTGEREALNQMVENYARKA